MRLCETHGLNLRWWVKPSNGSCEMKTPVFWQRALSDTRFGVIGGVSCFKC